MSFNFPKTDNFYVISISYEKADTKVRGKYSFFPSQVEEFSKITSKNNFGELFILSTCNRTEIYVNTQKIDDIIDLFCSFIDGYKIEFTKYSTIYQGNEAIFHLLKVASGLESQILGDFEIIGQLKTWFYRFKKHHLTNSFQERLINTAIQISKIIKAETGLSDGSASVSFTAVNYILTNVSNLSEKNILLLGAGKIGRNTCENLVKHSGHSQITIINRTDERAEKLAEKFIVNVKSFKDLKIELRNSDIIIVATGSEKPMIKKEDLPTDKPILIIDLSVPANVHPSVYDLKNVSLINVDQLSKMVDLTLEQRKKEIPRALDILNKHILEFNEWERNRKLVPFIQNFKEELLRLQTHNFNQIKKNLPTVNGKETILSEKLVQKLTNRLAEYLIQNPEKAEETNKILNDIFHFEKD